MDNALLTPACSSPLSIALRRRVAARSPMSGASLIVAAARVPRRVDRLRLHCRELEKTAAGDARDKPMGDASAAQFGRAMELIGFAVMHQTFTSSAAN